MFRSGKDAAEDATVAASLRLKQLQRVLQHTLRVNDAVDWEALRDRSKFAMPSTFPEPKPVRTRAHEPGGSVQGHLGHHCGLRAGRLQFASGKPLTLLTGSNLLHLLEKHGYRAKIDLKEARETLAATICRVLE